MGKEGKYQVRTKGGGKDKEGVEQGVWKSSNSEAGPGICPLSMPKLSATKLSVMKIWRRSFR